MPLRADDAMFCRADAASMTALCHYYSIRYFAATPRHVARAALLYAVR